MKTKKNVFENYVKRMVQYNKIHNKELEEKDKNSLKFYFVETKEDLLNKNKLCYYDTKLQSIVYEITEYKKCIIVNYCKKVLT